MAYVVISRRDNIIYAYYQIDGGEAARSYAQQIGADIRVWPCEGRRVTEEQVREIREHEESVRGWEDNSWIEAARRL